jgi:thiamine kinase-like enzyme
MLETITKAFKCGIKDIVDIQPLKKGMTNDSFIFGIRGKDGRFIIRIPGVGTDMLIDRHKEYAVYQEIAALGFCDDIVHIDPESGYKITIYWEGARNCDPTNSDDIDKCIIKLRDFHNRKLAVPHCFCPFERIEFYESLWEGKQSVYADYGTVKANILGLKEYIDALPKDWVLAHIDAVPDNFIFLSNGQIRLIDWEYAAMQDPHLDIAMFIVYAMYERPQAEDFIDRYFMHNCPGEIRKKIYAYIAICGLLWSNWCEYKGQLGSDFGDYALKQYWYAKEYYDIFLGAKNGA